MNRDFAARAGVAHTPDPLRHEHAEARPRRVAVAALGTAAFLGSPMNDAPTARVAVTQAPALYAAPAPEKAAGREAADRTARAQQAAAEKAARDEARALASR